MATYIILQNFTDQGIRNIKKVPERRKAAMASAEKLGIKIKAAYWTMGAYDAVVVVDAPTDETVTAFTVRGGSLGNIRTQTLRAFSADEVDNILAKIQ